MSDETRDVEALAEVFVGWWITGRSQLDRDQANALADGVLRSDWLAEHDARVRAEALREFADTAQSQMAEAWGGPAAWFTTGEKVAVVVCDWLRDWEAGDE